MISFSAPPALGMASIFHVVPFQVSISGSALVYPTAMQSVPEMQATPDRLASEPLSGVGWIAQVLPL